MENNGNRLLDDDVILDEYERHTLDLIAEMDSKRIEREEGIQEGIQLRDKSIIKSMLKKKMSYEDISEITGKTIEEIKEIENSTEIEE